MYQINQQKFLEETELEHLTKVLERNVASDPRNVTFLFLLIHTGARVGEALAIRPIDLNDVQQAVFVRGIKGSNDREIPVPGWLYRLLIDLRAKHTGEGPLFTFGYQRAIQIWQNYRPVKKKLHSLRHTFAIRLYKKTKDLRVVQLALGHRNIENTMVYASYVYSTEELRKIIL